MDVYKNKSVVLKQNLSKIKLWQKSKAFPYFLEFSRVHVLKTMCIKPGAKQKYTNVEKKVRALRV